jgi:hypothetical protein
MSVLQVEKKGALNRQKQDVRYYSKKTQLKCEGTGDAAVMVTADATGKEATTR